MTTFENIGVESWAAVPLNEIWGRGAAMILYRVVESKHHGHQETEGISAISYI